MQHSQQEPGLWRRPPRPHSWNGSWPLPQPLLVRVTVETRRNEQTGAPTFTHFGDIGNVSGKHYREPFIGHSKKKKNFKGLSMPVYDSVNITYQICILFSTFA